MNNRMGLFGAVEDEEDIIKTYGPECVFNGGFDDDERWEILIDWFIAGGVANYPGTDDDAHLRQSDINMILPIKVNTNYKFSFDVVALTVTEFLFAVYPYDMGIVVPYIYFEYHKTGHYERFFRTGADVYGGGVRIYATILDMPPSDGGTIDNFSIKECLWK